MQVIYERCAGLDVHKKSVVACFTSLENGQSSKERQTFSTMTSDLVRLRDWLKEHGCTHAASDQYRGIHASHNLANCGRHPQKRMKETVD